MIAPSLADQCRSRVAAAISRFSRRCGGGTPHITLTDVEIAKQAADAALRAADGDQEAAAESRSLLEELRRRKLLRW